MDISSVIALLVGTASMFVGAILAMTSSANKERHVRQDKTIADHEGRIQYLEKRDAVRDSQFETVVQKLDEVSLLLREHINRGDDGR